MASRRLYFATRSVRVGAPVLIWPTFVATGKPIVITVMDVCRFERGKIVEHWGVPDRFALLAQLGLLPQPRGEQS